MKSINYCRLLVILFFSLSTAYAQENFIPGYIIKLNNDTVKGFEKCVEKCFGKTWKKNWLDILYFFEGKFLIEVDEDTYNNTVPGVSSYMLPDGTTVYKEIDRGIIYIYDFEDKTNEQKRSIKLIKNNYASLPRK